MNQSAEHIGIAGPIKPDADTVRQRDFQSARGVQALARHRPAKSGRANMNRNETFRVRAPGQILPPRIKLPRGNAIPTRYRQPARSWSKGLHHNALLVVIAPDASTNNPGPDLNLSRPVGKTITRSRTSARMSAITTARTTQSLPRNRNAIPFALVRQIRILHAIVLHREFDDIFPHQPVDRYVGISSRLRTNSPPTIRACMPWRVYQIFRVSFTQQILLIFQFSNLMTQL